MLFRISILVLGIAFAAAADEKPNVVFILADDFGWRDAGCYGSSFYDTPNLDRLAESGVRFTQAYATCPVCSPTRASILSGKYPARMNTTDWFGAPQPDAMRKHWTRKKPLLPAAYVDRLPLEEVTLAEAFKAHGYRTAFAGKWHLGREGFHPEDQGFDHNFGGFHKGSPPGGYFSPYKNPKLENGPKGEHLPARLAQESIGFMESAGDDPFLLYLSFYSVHTPLQGREDLIAKYKARAETVAHDGPKFIPEGERKARQVQDHPVYGAMVEAMDAAIGDVLNALDRLGVADDTIVMFFSDNGGLSTSEGSPTSNVPLRAGKGWLYEGGIREPFIVRWPGKADPGAVCETPVTGADFYPTLLAMAGLDALPDQHVDGVNLVPLLTNGNPPARERIFWHYPHYGNQGGAPGAAVRGGDWKLIHWFEDDRIELFNLAEDIGEMENRAEANPAVVQELSAALKAWQFRVGARLPSENTLTDAEEE